MRFVKCYARHLHPDNPENGESRPGRLLPLSLYRQSQQNFLCCRADSGGDFLWSILPTREPAT